MLLLKRGCWPLAWGRLGLPFAGGPAKPGQELVPCTASESASRGPPAWSPARAEQKLISDLGGKAGLWRAANRRGFPATTTASPYSRYCRTVSVKEAAASHLLPPVCRGVFFPEDFFLSQKTVFWSGPQLLGSWSLVVPQG